MKLSLLALLITPISFNIYAGTKSFQTTYKVNKPLDHALRIYLDFENTCMEGCKYFSPSIKKMVKLNLDVSPNTFYIWTHVDDIKDVRYFSKIIITGSSSDALSVFQKQVSKERGKELAQLTGYTSSPVLKSLQFKTEFSPSKKTQYTRIVHSSKAQYGSLLQLLSKKIYTSLVAFSDATKANLNAPQ